MPNWFDAESDWDLCLYVAGDNPLSAEAILTVLKVCEKSLPDAYHLEIVNLLDGYLDDEVGQLVTVPCLLRRSPGPRIQIVGDIPENLTRLIQAQQPG